ncbi:hypothetical protein PsorP6_008087 [Peronosclerospora sorghi]|uniref:Uncharacterized protein n=1 Tax=Peronosclerospora sorghi TaxID=230839 RepID=A0ACC0WAT8_9STRA|nr:hypothetical protein PsorP6_008087 [Peronosclerospora sorghi]
MGKLWDEEDDESLKLESNDVVEGNDQIEVEIPGIDVSVDEHKRIRQPKDGDPALTLVPSSATDEVSGSSDDGKDGQGRTKTYACHERNKDAIDEALTRAESKQMTHDSSPSPQTSQGAESGLKYIHPVAPTTPRSEESSTEAPSLVIRPIAYDQALQAAEQHQQ